MAFKIDSRRVEGRENDKRQAFQITIIREIWNSFIFLPSFKGLLRFDNQPRDLATWERQIKKISLFKPIEF